MLSPYATTIYVVELFSFPYSFSLPPLFYPFFLYLFVSNG